MRAFVGSFLLLLSAAPLCGYSVLTHEAIIDSAWDKSIAPALKARFPNATADDLAHAHAYAYGGCIIQDMGYFPFGSKQFSDLLHYVRTGDFVMTELADAQNIDEYAFALGSLAHYVADNIGHAEAVNVTVGAEYPKLEQKFGRSVTYVDDPKSHLRVEFSFDVLEIARGSYAPQSYHDLIGFNIAKDLVDRAFFETYGLRTSDLFTDMDTSIATYRYGVSTLIPRLTRQAWDSNRDSLIHNTPGIKRARFVYSLRRAEYEKEWSHKYQRPSLRVRFLGWLVSHMPKIGPLRILAYKAPTKQTETWFENSFNATVTRYTALIGQARNGSLRLVDMNFDTGEVIKPATYRLADKAYANLAIHLADSKESQVDPKLAGVVLAYFSNADLPFATKQNPTEWKELGDALAKLKAGLATAAPANQ